MTGSQRTFTVGALGSLLITVAAAADVVERRGAAPVIEGEVTVIDDRSEYANTGKFPEADRIIVDDIGKTINKLPITSDTYIVIVTRGHRHDAEALKSCISSQAAYIGMIGSRRKIALMRENFIKKGWATAKEFDRVCAPIGLSIHSKTIEEIAVSIAAQLILIRGESRDKLSENK